MNGKVVFISKLNGFVAIKTDDGNYTVVDNISGSAIETNDVISGDLGNLTATSIKNVSKCKDIAVIVKDSLCDEETAKFLLSIQ